LFIVAPAALESRQADIYDNNMTMFGYQIINSSLFPGEDFRAKYASLESFSRPSDLSIGRWAVFRRPGYSLQR
jgi:hypothetical protein